MPMNDSISMDNIQFNYANAINLFLLSLNRNIYTDSNYYGNLLLY